MSYNALRRGRHSETNREYLITTVTHKRRRLFTDFHAARLLIGELRELQQQGSCTWLAWIVMPDHFHGLLRLESDSDLSEVVRLLKGRTSRRLHREHGVSGAVWQSNFHDRALRKDEQRIEVARYIVANPLRAGLVSKLSEYPYWDCVWL